MKLKFKIIIVILSIFLLISVVLNGFLIKEIYKFKQAVTVYKVYADELYTKLNDIQQKTDKLENNIKDVIKNSVKQKHK